MSYSSRSTVTQGGEARSSAEGTTAMLYVCNGSLSNERPQQNERLWEPLNAVLKRSGINQCRLK